MLVAPPPPTETLVPSSATRPDSGLRPPVDDHRTGLIVTVASAVALGFSLLVTAQTMFSMMDHGHAWWRIFGWHLGSWLFWVPFAPWVVKLGGDVRWGEGSGRTLRLGALSVLLAGGQLVVSGAAATLLQPYQPVARTRFLRYLENEFLPWVAVDLIAFWCLIAIGSAIAANRRSRAHELRETRLETELARAQLDALRLEIQPHFLFNTLNSVAALIRRRSNDRALEVVLGLSELLRATLDRSDRHQVPLREEVDFVERYLALQKTRFADRLRVTVDVPDELAEVPVPWLILQPLVENAIRHGIAPRAGGGELEIRAASGGDQLELLVTDDGPGLGDDRPRDEKAKGLGLDNIRSRLRQLHGDEASLGLTREADRTVARVRLPIPVSEPLASAG